MENINKMMENVDKTIKTLDKNSVEELDLFSLIELEEETGEDDNKDFIKCGSHTDPNALAFYIARQFESEDVKDCIIIQTIGPQALSKAIMAIIRLKGIVAPYIDGSTLVSRFSVRKLQLPNGEERTSIRTRLFPIPDRYVV